MAQIRSRATSAARRGQTTRATTSTNMQQRNRRTRLAAGLFPLIATACLLLPTANAFAAWFVDRRVSCLTDLAANEIIMNNGVLPYSTSREPSIHIKVGPLGNEDTAQPDSEYIVQFVLPDEAKERVADVQYVLELTGESSDADAPAKFTSPPSGGGIGCEGRRSHGKAGAGDTAAIFTINENAATGARFEIVAGWATGHESVTLTEKVVVVVGQGVQGKEEKVPDTDDDATDADDGRDDFLQDDEAEAELEELLLEEEREDLEGEIEEAEEEAIEALEEKRIEADGLGSEINEAEEMVFESMEENRKHVNKALDSLKEEIIIAQPDRKQKPERHTAEERMQAQKRHREHHDRRHVENRLQEMQRKFAKQYDARKDKLEDLIDVKDTLKDSISRLKKIENKEHERARKQHIKPIPREELKLDMEELRQKAKEKMHKLGDTLGVNELMNDPHVKKLRAKLKDGTIRGGEGRFHGDQGKPLPPEGRHFLVVMFTLFGLVAVVRWHLDKKRRPKKGRRTL